MKSLQTRLTSRPNCGLCLGLKDFAPEAKISVPVGLCFGLEGFVSSNLSTFRRQLKTFMMIVL